MEKVLSTSSGQIHSTSTRKRSHRFWPPAPTKLTLIPKRRRRNKGQFFKLLSLNPSFPRCPTFFHQNTVTVAANRPAVDEARKFVAKMPAGLGIVRRVRGDVICDDQSTASRSTWPIKDIDKAEKENRSCYFTVSFTRC